MIIPIFPLSRHAELFDIALYGRECFSCRSVVKKLKVQLDEASLIFRTVWPT
jgi:hypothetical protein